MVIFTYTHIIEIEYSNNNRHSFEEVEIWEIGT
jgi:hypothetical protein